MTTTFNFQHTGPHRPNVDSSPRRERVWRGMSLDLLNTPPARDSVVFRFSAKGRDVVLVEEKKNTAQQGINYGDEKSCLLIQAMQMSPSSVSWSVIPNREEFMALPWSSTATVSRGRILRTRRSAFRNPGISTPHGHSVNNA